MKSIINFIFLLFTIPILAQVDNKNLPEGNKKYQEKKYAEAEAKYRISQSKLANNSIAKYNLGNAIYRQKQSSEAKLKFEKAAKESKSRSEKHKAYHNLGNSYMNEKNYSQAVEAYKNALRNNPNDEETRYNYALAKKMLKENPPKDDKKDNKKDKKEDKKDDKKDNKEDKKDENKDKKEGDKDKKENPENNKQEGQPKPKPGGLTKEQLQNLLDAINNEEKKIQEKVNAKKVKGKPVQTEKDW
ncbi:MAG TPA: tetratricopeptide repeat protein [Flavobacterium sp.]|jgi:tetratricopeptide (TPR) repeat protein|nr:tetratricopeptide repeat protein [Flavobacterium sp.]